MAFVAPTDGSLTVNLAGTATDETGVRSVRVTLQDRDTGRYLQANGTMAATLASRDATLGTPNGDQHDLVAAADHPAHRRRLALLGHGLRHARPVRREPGHRAPTRSTRVTVRPPCRDTLGPAAERRDVRPRQDRGHGTRRGRPRPVREHRVGAGRRGQRRRAST